ncbi:rhomboid family intramembrane serine protease [Nocardiopsis aegyptia]
MTAPPPPSGATPEPGPTAPRTCYRHSDRETGVSCTRCGRPICPDCMVEAAVGFQCPSCVAEGRRGTRTARTTFGGRTVTRPYVTWTVLALMAVGYLVQMGTADPVGSAAASPLVRLFGMLGYAYDPAAGQNIGVLGGEWYRLVTAAFLHGGIFHLLFNGYATYLLGTQLERWLGHGRFLALWVLGALSGSALTLVVASYGLELSPLGGLPEPVVAQLSVPLNQVSIGASGAVFALFGAVFVLGRRLSLDLRAVGILLAVNLVLTFLIPRISWTAHIGGLIAGLLLGAVFAYAAGSAARATRRTLVHALLVAAYAVLVLALVFLVAPGLAFA